MNSTSMSVKLSNGLNGAVMSYYSMPNGTMTFGIANNDGTGHFPVLTNQSGAINNALDVLYSIIVSNMTFKAKRQAVLDCGRFGKKFLYEVQATGHVINGMNASVWVSITSNVVESIYVRNESTGMTRKVALLNKADQFVPKATKPSITKLI